MDRRRYIPSPEGLEGRALLSTVAATGRPSAATAAATQAQTATIRQLASSALPESYDQKLQRIENLPYFLAQLQPGRFLPTDTIQSIQESLIEITAKLHAPPSSTLEAFNLEIRDTIAEASLSAQNARGLNHDFGQVLTGAGASPAQVAKFTADMNQLATVDSQSPNPTYLASNDYAVILQTALAVGRPIQTPRAPRLSPTDGQPSSNGGGITTNPLPILVGSYEAGASDDSSTRIEILDSGSQVLGSGVVGSDGRYSATLTKPLAEGRHTLFARAVDVVGNESNLSPGYTLRVVARPSRPTAAAQFLIPPAGPRGLRPA
jgi:hypothetical protein